MSVGLKQNTDGSLGLQGATQAQGQFIPIHARVIASDVDNVIFIADRKYIVKSVSYCPTVAGTDGSAVTLGIKRSANGSNIGSGTKVHASTMDLKGTINTIQTMSPPTDLADTVIVAGQRLSLNFSGTLTAVVGNVTVMLCPA